MRRTKETVLKDLPPKIIQDYLCDMSPLQALLYEDFASVDAAEVEAGTRPAGHVFQVTCARACVVSLAATDALFSFCLSLSLSHSYDTDADDSAQAVESPCGRAGQGRVR